MLNIKTKYNITCCVPSDLTLMTPFVLLEQEGWFEEEVDMLPKLAPANSIMMDIGANYGIYTLVLAKQAMQSGGRVISFEPNPKLHEYITASLQANQFMDYVTLRQEGMSCKDGQATFYIPKNPELASLFPVNNFKTDRVTVSLTTLDIFAKSLQVDEHVGLIKLDAEGAERDILAGGQDFFASHQPIVMFEIKHGDELNHGLAEDFIAMGYGLYRMLPELQLLEPVSLEDSLDAYQLNLFACPEREVKRLAQAGLLTQTPLTALDEPVLRDSKQYKSILSLELFTELSGLPIQLQTPLLHINAALDANVKPFERRAHAYYANKLLQSLPDELKGVDVTLAQARLYFLLGERNKSVATLQALIRQMDEAALKTCRWRIAPHYAFDQQPVNGDIIGWQRCAVYEALVHLVGFSSYFVSDLAFLNQVYAQPHHTLAMERRFALTLQRVLKVITQPESALSKQHLNGSIWQHINEIDSKS